MPISSVMYIIVKSIVNHAVDGPKKAKPTDIYQVKHHTPNFKVEQTLYGFLCRVWLSRPSALCPIVYIISVITSIVSWKNQDIIVHSVSFYIHSVFMPLFVSSAPPSSGSSGSGGLFFGGRGHPIADVVNDRAAEDALVLGRKSGATAVENQPLGRWVRGCHWQLEIRVVFLLGSLDNSNEVKHPVDWRGMDEAGKTTEILEDQLCARGVCESEVRESAVCGRVAGESVAWERVAWEGVVCGSVVWVIKLCAKDSRV